MDASIDLINEADYWFSNKGLSLASLIFNSFPYYVKYSINVVINVTSSHLKTSLFGFF